MSGQAGIYCFDQRPIDHGLADWLSTGLSSQGPDGGSEHLGPGLLMVYSAFTFDSLSRVERQPYCSEKGNWMTFDGRLDNREDLVLLLNEYLRSDKTDVALALAAYEKWGEAGLNRLIGDWSLAIWDEQQRRIVIASDYMGVRPLFYFKGNGFVAWSSSMSQLVDWMDVSDDLDNHYIAAYLTSSPTYERTIYQGVRYVPCGQAIIVDQHCESQMAYWSPPTDSRIRYQQNSEYEEHLLHLFREAVLTRLRTDEVVCCDLSGGLDSSSVTCMAHHLITSGAACPARLVTLSLSPPGMDDDRFVAIVEQHCGINGIHLGYPDSWSLDLPAGPMPTIGLPIALEVRNARKEHSVRVSLTGQGGDLVMGNTLDDTDQLADSLCSYQFRQWLKQSYMWAQSLRIPIWRVLWRSIIPLLSTDAQQRIWRGKGAVAQDAYAHLAHQTLADSAFLARYSEPNSRLHTIEYGKALPSQKHFLFDVEMLRATHAVAASPHAEPVKRTHPFWHRSLLEFSASIPRDELCRPAKPRHLMRRAFKGLLPPGVLERRTKAISRTALDLTLQHLAPALLRSPAGLLTEVYGYAGGGRLTQALGNPQAADFHRKDLTPLVCLEVWLQTRRAADMSVMNASQSLLQPVGPSVATREPILHPN